MEAFGFVLVDNNFAPVDPNRIQILSKEWEVTNLADAHKHPQINELILRLIKKVERND